MNKTFLLFDQVTELSSMIYYHHIYLHMYSKAVIRSSARRSHVMTMNIFYLIYNVRIISLPKLMMSTPAAPPPPPPLPSPPSSPLSTSSSSGSVGYLASRSSSDSDSPARGPGDQVVPAERRLLRYVNPSVKTLYSS